MWPCCFLIEVVPETLSFVDKVGVWLRGKGFWEKTSHYIWINTVLLKKTYCALFLVTCCYILFLPGWMTYLSCVLNLLPAVVCLVLNGWVSSKLYAARLIMHVASLMSWRKLMWVFNCIPASVEVPGWLVRGYFTAEWTWMMRKGTGTAVTEFLHFHLND